MIRNSVFLTFLLLFLFNSTQVVATVPSPRPRPAPLRWKAYAFKYPDIDWVCNAVQPDYVLTGSTVSTLTLGHFATAEEANKVCNAFVKAQGVPTLERKIRQYQADYAKLLSERQLLREAIRSLQDALDNNEVRPELIADVEADIARKEARIQAIDVELQSLAATIERLKEEREKAMQ